MDFLMIIHFLQYLAGQLSQRRINGFTITWARSKSEFRKQKKVILGSQIITSDYFVEVFLLLPDQQILICYLYLCQLFYRKKPPWLIVKFLYTILIIILCHNRLCLKISKFKSIYSYPVAHISFLQSLYLSWLGELLDYIIINACTLNILFALPFNIQRVQQKPNVVNVLSAFQDTCHNISPLILDYVLLKEDVHFIPLVAFSLKFASALLPVPSFRPYSGHGEVTRLSNPDSRERPFTASFFASMGRLLDFFLFFACYKSCMH
jgi:hypothetical protein